jgi:hypothetical protein
MNPYLAFAAIFSAGCYGIKNKLELDIPPVSVTTNGLCQFPFHTSLGLKVFSFFNS